MLVWNTLRVSEKEWGTLPPLGFSQKSQMFSFGSQRTRKSRLGAEKSNPRDKRDLLDDRTACQADFTLRKQGFKLNSSIFWRKYLLKPGKIEKARCVAQSLVFSKLTREGNFLRNWIWSWKKFWAATKATWPWTQPVIQATGLEC